MKKSILILSVLALAGQALAQTPTKKPPVTPAKKTSTATKPATGTKTAATTAPVLKTLNDSASYAIGVSVASFYQQQGVKDLNTALISRAINDVLGNKTKLIDENTANMVMNKVMSKMQEDKSRPAIDSGIAFLARNGKRTGVKTTASGLQYEIIKEGTGIKPTVNDTFVVHYRGTLLDGTEFDASYNRNEPLVMPLKQVVQGWIEGLQLMNVGSHFKLWIPYNLAYGSFDNGPIPGGSTLVFDMELLDVKKGPQ